MRRIAIFLLSLSITILFVGCGENSSRSDDIEGTYFVISDFKEGMELSDLKSELGDPIENIGSGVNILMYKYTADKMAFFEFNLNNKLLQVRIVDNKQN